jgi:hypothetical protein
MPSPVFAPPSLLPPQAMVPSYTSAVAPITVADGYGHMSLPSNGYQQPGQVFPQHDPADYSRPPSTPQAYVQQGYPHQGEASYGLAENLPQASYGHATAYAPQTYAPQMSLPQAFDSPTSPGYASRGYPQQDQARPQGFPSQSHVSQADQGFGSQGHTAQGYQGFGLQGHTAQGSAGFPQQSYVQAVPQAYAPQRPQAYPQQAPQGYTPAAPGHTAFGLQGYDQPASQHYAPQGYPDQGFGRSGSPAYNSVPQGQQGQQGQGYPALPQSQAGYASAGQHSGPHPANGFRTQEHDARGARPPSGFVTPGYGAGLPQQSYSPDMQASSQRSPSVNGSSGNPVVGRLTNRIVPSNHGHGTVSSPTDPVRWIGPDPQAPQGYSDAPPSRGPAATTAPQGLMAGPRWDTRDEAPRYSPPGSEEIETDPFGLLSLPDQHHYRGPRLVPDDATFGLLLGVLSFAICLVGFVGYRRARRAEMLISSAPTRYRGRWLASLGMILNVIGPVVSLAAIYLWRQT